MRKPNFIIVGAPKAGTTSLHYYLDQHPNVFMSKFKEPHYFASDMYAGARFIKSEKAYLKLFSKSKPEHTMIGEASVLYLYSRVAIDNIRRFNPDTKIIVMLRNPVELVHAFWAELLHGFEEDQHNFQTAWELQDKRLSGENIPESCRCPEQLQYRSLFLLGQQMEKLYSIFPKEQVHICMFDQYKENTTGEFNKILDFLGLRQGFDIDFSVQNKNFSYPRNGLVHFIFRPPGWAAPVIEALKDMFISKRDIIADILMNKFARVEARQPLDPEFINTLKKYFRADIRLLEGLIGTDIKHWYQTKPQLERGYTRSYCAHCSRDQSFL